MMVAVVSEIRWLTAILSNLPKPQNIQVMWCYSSMHVVSLVINPELAVTSLAVC